MFVASSVALMQATPLLVALIPDLRAISHLGTLIPTPTVLPERAKAWLPSLGQCIVHPMVFISSALNKQPASITDAEMTDPSMEAIDKERAHGLEVLEKHHRTNAREVAPRITPMERQVAAWLPRIDRAKVHIDVLFSKALQSGGDGEHQLAKFKALAADTGHLPPSVLKRITDADSMADVSRVLERVVAKAQEPDPQWPEGPGLVGRASDWWYGTGGDEKTARQQYDVDRAETADARLAVPALVPSLMKFVAETQTTNRDASVSSAAAALYDLASLPEPREAKGLPRDFPYGTTLGVHLNQTGRMQEIPYAIKAGAIPAKKDKNGIEIHFDNWEDMLPAAGAKEILALDSLQQIKTASNGGTLRPGIGWSSPISSFRQQREEKFQGAEIAYEKIRNRPLNKLRLDPAEFIPLFYDIFAGDTDRRVAAMGRTMKVGDMIATRPMTTIFALWNDPKTKWNLENAEKAILFSDRFKLEEIDGVTASVQEAISLGFGLSYLADSATVAAAYLRDKKWGDATSSYLVTFFRRARTFLVENLPLGVRLFSNASIVGITVAQYHLKYQDVLDRPAGEYVRLYAAGAGIIGAAYMGLQLLIDHKAATRSLAEARGEPGTKLGATGWRALRALLRYVIPFGLNAQAFFFEYTSTPLVLNALGSVLSFASSAAAAIVTQLAGLPSYLLETLGLAALWSERIKETDSGKFISSMMSLLSASVETVSGLVGDLVTFLLNVKAPADRSSLSGWMDVFVEAAQGGSYWRILIIFIVAYLGYRVYKRKRESIVAIVKDLVWRTLTNRFHVLFAMYRSGIEKLLADLIKNLLTHSPVLAAHVGVSAPKVIKLVADGEAIFGEAVPDGTALKNIFLGAKEGREKAAKAAKTKTDEDTAAAAWLGVRHGDDIAPSTSTRIRTRPLVRTLTRRTRLREEVLRRAHVAGVAKRPSEVMVVRVQVSPPMPHWPALSWKGLSTAAIVAASQEEDDMVLLDQVFR